MLRNDKRKCLDYATPKRPALPISAVRNHDKPNADTEILTHCVRMTSKCKRRFRSTLPARSGQTLRLRTSRCNTLRQDDPALVVRKATHPLLAQRIGHPA